jgi:hypothetical protein
MTWWNRYHEEVNRDFMGDKFSPSPTPKHSGVTRLHEFSCWGNSGIGSIALAIGGQAERIIMVGYDCQLTGGKSHWHGDHPQGLTNAVGIKLWPDAFWMFAEEHPQLNIVNASRETALTMFPRQTLEQALDCNS